MTSTALQSALDEPNALPADARASFDRDGFLHVPGVFNQDLLSFFSDEITRLTDAHNKYRDVPLEQRSTYGKAFIQVTNLWRKSDLARQFSFSRRLARIAAELLGIRGVRMWHDQALYKEPGGGFTPWHVDQQYWPMATDRCVTAWIPLQPVSREMGPLAFAPGSHRLDLGRSLAISDESERLLASAMQKHGLREHSEPFAAGEVSFHLGWTLHRAGGNTTTQPRRVHTVIYMDADMRLAEPANPNQKIDWEAFTPSTRVGEVMDDELNPVLYSA